MACSCAVFAVSDLRILLGDVAGTAQEQAIGELHDVGLVDAVHAPALVLPCVFESKAGDTRRSDLGDDLQALDDARNHLMLDARIQTFGILADDDEVHIGIAGSDVRKIANGPEVCVKREALAEGYVNAGEPAA